MIYTYYQYITEADPPRPVFSVTSEGSRPQKTLGDKPAPQAETVTLHNSRLCYQHCWLA